MHTRAAESFRTKGMAETDDLVRIARAAYEGGELGILELLDALRTQREARLRILELTGAARRAAARARTIGRRGGHSMNSKFAIALSILPFFSACKDNQAGRQAPAAEELPTLSLTRWSERTELFMEHSALVRGRQAPFAVHLTDLASFRPLSDARVVLDMEKNGKVISFVSASSSRPGIFRVDMTVPDPGCTAGFSR
jgi:hypothetical protein